MSLIIRYANWFVEFIEKQWVEKTSYIFITFYSLLVIPLRIIFLILIGLGMSRLYMLLTG